MKYVVQLLIVLISLNVTAQADPDFRQYAMESFDLYKELLAIPNDAFYPDDIEKNVVWCEAAFKKRGFGTKRLETPAAPLLLASKMSDKKDAKTVLIYLQLDGQPVDGSFWFQDSPYEATLKKQGDEGGWDAIPWSNLSDLNFDDDWRIFARSASDSKGPVAKFITALDIIQDRGESIDYNLKVIMDFEEELGSPNLPAAVDKYISDLTADMLVIFDGPMHASGKPTLSFGARGIATVQLTVFGPLFPQHSGHYGNYVPNPAIRLSQLIASMKDVDGRVTIPGWYDGITISDKVKATLRKIPDYEREINLSKGIAAADKVAPTYQESLQYPSLNVRGMQSGWVREERRTIIPSTAIAEIDIRLVLESDPERMIKLLRDHIATQGFYITEGKPTSKERNTHNRIASFTHEISYRAFRTEFDTGIGHWLSDALAKAQGEEPIKIRTSGGSIPISPFVNKLNIPAVGVPTVQRDNNQHSPNENLRLGNYVNGIKTIYAILSSSPQ